MVERATLDLGEPQLAWHSAARHVQLVVNDLHAVDAGQRERLPDKGRGTPGRRLGTMFCSGGRRGLEIEIAPGDLIKAAGATVAAIAAP